jgi:hypothetical protein
MIDKYDVLPIDSATSFCFGLKYTRREVLAMSDLLRFLLPGQASPAWDEPTSHLRSSQRCSIMRSPPDLPGSLWSFAQARQSDRQHMRFYKLEDWGPMGPATRSVSESVSMYAEGETFVHTLVRSAWCAGNLRKSASPRA